MEADTVYFRRRASEERTAAMYTRHPRARKAHIDMAERYEDLVRAIAARERHLRVDPSASQPGPSVTDHASVGNS
ncbi:MAG TPA: hypothetical protein VM265_03855 [Sphingomicrobium sp.]|nr:hypothetical protein [Sphingomicrobium sp.]